MARAFNARTRVRTRAAAAGERARPAGGQQPRGERYAAGRGTSAGAAENRPPPPRRPVRGGADAYERPAPSSRVGVSGQGGGRSRPGPQRPSPRGGAGGARPRNSEPVYVQRSTLAGKHVITRTTGADLGVISQVWVDCAGGGASWRVVALDVRPSRLLSALNGEADCVMLSSLRQIGDVVLVHDERDAVDGSRAKAGGILFGLLDLTGKEVVTETGAYLGKVRDFTFSPEDGAMTSLHFDALGAPAIPAGVVSTYAVDTADVLSAGPDRVVVAAGAEQRLQQLTSGALQRLALYEPPWEAAYRDMAYDMDFYQPQQSGFYQQDPRTSYQLGGSPREATRAYPYQNRRQGAAQGGEEERQPQQQRWEEFVEVQERAPVFEAQVASRQPPMAPSNQPRPGPPPPPAPRPTIPVDVDAARYDSDEDRL